MFCETFICVGKRSRLDTHKLFVTIFALLFSVSAIQVQGQDANKVRVVSGADVMLTDSWVKDREALNSKYVLSIEADRLLHNFRLTAGLPTDARALGGWEDSGCGLRGHFTGHYLSVLSTLVQRSHDSVAEMRLRQLVDGLAECQSKFSNGYLGAIPERDFDTLERTYGNVWAPYYTLHKIMQGLVDAYVKTGNETALKVVTKAADYVCNRMDKLSTETLEGMFMTRQANPGNEHGAMNEVLEEIYSLTKNERFLKCAKLFDRDWFVNPLANHEDNLSGLHSNTHIVLVNGFVRRYENTGEQKFRDAAVNFWDILMKGHVYVNGTSSGPRPEATTPTSKTAEHWGDAHKLTNTLSGQIAESCVTHNTRRVASNLFQWTAEAMYMDESFNIFYNATMACQNKLDGRVTYHLPLGSPRHKSWLDEEDFRCCNGSSIETFASLDNGIYYVGDKSLYVTNYIPSEMTWKEQGVQMAQTGNFPYSPTVELTVKQNKTKKYELNLLIPSWAKAVEVSINGGKAKKVAKAGSFLTFRRKWKDGDSVTLTFQYPFYLKAMPDEANKVALFHGPLLLAFVGENAIELPESEAELLKAVSGNPTDGYTLQSKAGVFRLKPLMDILDEGYSCYFMKAN